MSASSCRELDRAVSSYVDGELEPSTMLAVEKHVEECPDCAERGDFEKAMRVSVRTAVLTVRASDRLRARMACVMAAAEFDDAEPSRSSAQATDTAETVAPRMLPWRVVGPLAAAAMLSLVLGSMSRANKDADVAASQRPTTSTASLMTLDTLLEELVDQHAHPLPPETTNPTDVARFDQFVGVPVRPLTFRQNPGTLIGARMVPVRKSRAAMLQYVMQNGHRVSVYVYNPRQVRMVATPKLRERPADTGPVYVGRMNGYSVAVADRRGVGYALASDLDEGESSNMIVAVDQQQ